MHDAQQRRIGKKFADIPADYGFNIDVESVTEGGVHEADGSVKIGNANADRHELEKLAAITAVQKLSAKLGAVSTHTPPIRSYESNYDLENL